MNLIIIFFIQLHRQNRCRWPHFADQPPPASVPERHVDRGERAAIAGPRNVHVRGQERAGILGQRKSRSSSDG